MSLIIYPFAVFILGFTTITHNFLKIYCMLAVILDYSSHHLNKQHWRYSNWKLTDSFYKHQDHLLMPCCSFQAELIRNQLHKELVFFTSVEQGVFFFFLFRSELSGKISSEILSCSDVFSYAIRRVILLPVPVLSSEPLRWCLLL